jgi:hypothetical protein
MLKAGEAAALAAIPVIEAWLARRDSREAMALPASRSRLSVGRMPA